LLVEKRLGEKAAGLVAMVMQIGHCTIGDLAGVFDFDEHGMSKVDTPTHNGNGTSNGTHSSGQKDPRQIGSLAELHHILRKLLRAGFLMKLAERNFKPNADVEDELGALVMEESFPDGKITGPKKQAEFKRSVDNLKRKWRDESEYSERRDVEGGAILARPGMDANKRQKLNGGLSNGHGGHGGDADFSGPRLPNNMSIGVNLAKCVVAMRSELLVQHAKRYLGYITAEVYRALLTALESKVRSVREDLVHYEDEDEEEEAQPVASVMEVAEFVDPNLDLAAGINGAKSDLPNGGPKAKKKGVIEYDNDFTDIGIKNEPGSDDEGTNGYSSMRNKNKRLDLKLLEEHDKEFCRRPGAAGQSEWRVNFPVLSKILLNAEIDTTIDRRFGPAAVRVARMLRQEGRLEEKGVAQKCLKHVKEIRGILAQMQAAGFLESQEVPKDQYRQPTRSLYLWFFDEKKVAQLVLHQAYQGIARCMQRMDVEQEKFQQILDKRERLRAMNPDAAKNFIIGKTGMLEEDGAPLSGVEKQQIALWRETQEKLLTQVKRLDDVVGVVRDFVGKDVTMNT
jgi:DNA-directed RNA polymerase III subunit RPC3